MAVAPQLADFGLPAWRDYEVFVEECRTSIGTSLEGTDVDRAVFVAEMAPNFPVGLANLVLVPNPNTGGRNVFLSDLVVDAAHRNRGVGGALLQRCEEWARERGADGLVLAVFQDNVGARRLYERYGFRDDVVRVVRPLDPE
jgi:GNAT superfamily N-acetyltransferase